MDDARPYHLTNHACRRCLGPILQSGQTFVCAICAASAIGSPTDICGCGIAPRKIGKREGFFRCMTNPAPSPANPARIVIGFAHPAADSADFRSKVDAA